MGKKSRRNRQKNPEQFKKNQENAIKKQNTECWCKTRAKSLYTPPFRRGTWKEWQNETFVRYK